MYFPHDKDYGANVTTAGPAYDCETDVWFYGPTDGNVREQVREHIDALLALGVLESRISGSVWDMRKDDEYPTHVIAVCDGTTYFHHIYDLHQR